MRSWVRFINILSPQEQHIILNLRTHQFEQYNSIESTTEEPSTDTLISTNTTTSTMDHNQEQTNVDGDFLDFETIPFEIKDKIVQEFGLNENVPSCENTSMMKKVEVEYKMLPQNNKVEYVTFSVVESDSYVISTFRNANYIAKNVHEDNQ